MKIFNTLDGTSLALPGLTFHRTFQPTNQTPGRGGGSRPSSHASGQGGGAEACRSALRTGGAGAPKSAWLFDHQQLKKFRKAKFPWTPPPSGPALGSGWGQAM